MERRRFANTDLTVSIIGLGCYGMSGAYGPADDAESIATIRRALDLGVNFLDTSASYGQGHNHRVIGEAICGRRHDVVIHSKSGSPRDGGPDAVRGGGDPRYLRQTCEQSLKNLGIETLDVFCMSRVDPHVPVEESVGGMAELVREGKTRFISLSECSAHSLKRGSAVQGATRTPPISSPGQQSLAPNEKTRRPSCSDGSQASASRCQRANTSAVVSRRTPRL